MAYNVKFLKGTAQNYADIATKDVNTFYYVDGKDLYLGTIKLSNGADLDAAVARVAKNEQDILAIQTALGELTATAFNALKDRMDVVEGKVSTLEGKVSTLETASADHETRLASAEGSVADHETRLGVAEGKVSTLETASADHETRLAAAEGSVADHETRLGVAEGKVADLEANSATKAELEAAVEALEGEDARIEKKIDDEVTRATGVEADFETRIAAMETFWDVTEDSDGVINKLKEIQEYIASDETGAAAMLESIQANTKAISDEAKRAADEEARIEGKIDALSPVVEANTGAIEAEVKRAGDEEKRIEEKFDGLVSGLGARVEANEGAIEDLQGEDERLAGLISDNADAIAANGELIAANAGLIAKNAEDIAKEAERAAGVEDGLNTRLLVVEQLAGVESGDGETIADKIEAAKEAAIEAANGYTDGQITALGQSLSNNISTAKSEAIEAAEDYTDAEIAKLADTVAKAASALQKEDIATGTANGTIKVKGDDVAVKGLGSAAFVDTTAFDAAGQAAAALEAANAHTTEALKSYYTKTEVDAQHAELTSYIDTALTWGQM